MPERQLKLGACMRPVRIAVPVHELGSGQNRPTVIVFNPGCLFQRSFRPAIELDEVSVSTDGTSCST